MDTVPDPHSLKQEIVHVLQCGRPGCPCAKGETVHCPVHDDAKPSLSVTVRNGRLLVHCHAECSQEAVIAALRERGLWPTPPNHPRQPPRPRQRIVATYDYRDETGALLFQVVREEPKAFRQRRPDGHGGWIWNLNGARRALYRLPELLAAPKNTSVFVVEGEKDADCLAVLGPVATTNPGGAGKWSAEYSEALRGRPVVVLPDNDEPGRAHAQHVAAALHGVAASVKVVELPGLPEKGDVSHWLDAGGTKEALKQLVAQGPEWQPPQAPNLAALLDTLVSFVRKYIVLTLVQLDAIALWLAVSWAVEAFDIVPILAITSPTKQTGKSHLLDVLELLVPRPLLASDASVAAIYRSIADPKLDRATVLLDEADTIFRDARNYSEKHEELRRLLNAGFERGRGAIRCEGEGQKKVVTFDVFGMKAIAMIGRPPETVLARSIWIQMQRRARHETYTKLRKRAARVEAAGIRRQLTAWRTARTIDLLREARPQVPDLGNDRAEDLWEPAFAVAEIAGGGWSERAKRAAVALCTDQVAEDDSPNIQLLAHIRDLWDRPNWVGKDRISSADLVARLRAIEDAPWATWDRVGLTQRGLATELKPFGIRPTKMRLDEGTQTRGYWRADFEDAWLRYCTPHQPPQMGSDPEQPEQANTVAGFSDFPDPEHTPPVPDAENSQTPRPERVVPDVPDVPPFDDGDRRVVVVRMGELLGYPEFKFKPGVTIAEGEGNWRTFAATASGEEIILALRALEQIQ